MVYSYSCDGCGETETDEIDGLPVGWTVIEDEHYCPGCSSVIAVLREMGLDES